MNAPVLAAAAVLGGIGVVAGAFGAHGLRGRLTPDQLASYETAVLYQLLHALVLLALGLYAQATGRSVQPAAGLLVVGIVLFSGSIYLLVLTGQRWLGPVTPLGGLCLIAGWLALLLLARSPS